MIKLSIKKGDTVFVLSGKDHAARLRDVKPEELEAIPPEQRRQEAEKRPGRRGKVLRVYPQAGKVLVEGINMVTKHARPKGGQRAAQMQTGRISQPAAMPISKLMLVCPRCDRPTHVLRRLVEGRRLRVCRRCQEVIDTLK